MQVMLTLYIQINTMTPVIQVQNFVCSRWLVTNVLLYYCVVSSYVQRANMKFHNGIYIPYTGWPVLPALESPCCM